MARTITNLGLVGTPDGIQRPWDLTLTREGAVWNLTGYTNPTFEGRNLRTKAAVTLDGSVSVTDAAAGIVRVDTDPTDALYQTPGIFEGRIWLTPSGGGDPEPSGVFRYEIGEAW